MGPRSPRVLTSSPPCTGAESHQPGLGTSSQGDRGDVRGPSSPASRPLAGPPASLCGGRGWAITWGGLWGHGHLITGCISVRTAVSPGRCRRLARPLSRWPLLSSQGTPGVPFEEQHVAWGARSPSEAGVPREGQHCAPSRSAFRVGEGPSLASGVGGAGGQGRGLRLTASTGFRRRQLSTRSQRPGPKAVKAFLCKYLQNIYLIKDLNPESIENCQDSKE